MNLSKHVTVAEFIKSDTAIRHGINNDMNATQTQKAIELCENVFEPLRAFLNNPIKISSWFRGVGINKRIGGSTTSQHCKGEAVDLKIDAIGFHYIKNNLDFDQMIWEFGTDTAPDWVHVSFNKGKNRKQVLRAKKINGKTVYTNY
jgi:uncharacterized protein YcbK (DUF882 family)